MPSPFPGMDPYLEYAAFWSSFHTRFIVAIADAIEPQLSSQYYVEVESRTYQSDEDEKILIGIPDAIVFAEKSNAQPSSVSVSEAAVATQVQPETVVVPVPLEMKERYLEVREMGTDDVITVIELLSLTNKRAKDGRAEYEKKRRQILGSQTHLVELDLLRNAKPMAMQGVQTPSPYRILISRSHDRPRANLYPIMLEQPLPNLPIPLKAGDAEPIVPLQSVFTQVYDRARYASRIDYAQPLPPPKLPDVEQQWVETVLAPMREQ
ncbi:MAG: DUF4058 family protein [Chroococcidiopsidaceae cyanobacterium CP_BM_RX_35]|nr:DUF4058 family protein [Chroococcidiopsidaceae cyanobacterium CP_BM_RX_35]